MTPMHSVVEKKWLCCVFCSTMPLTGFLSYNTCLNEYSEKKWKRRKNGYMKIKWIKSRGKVENGITAFKHGKNLLNPPTFVPPHSKTRGDAPVNKSLQVASYFPPNSKCPTQVVHVIYVNVNYYLTILWKKREASYPMMNLRINLVWQQRT